MVQQLTISVVQIMIQIKTQNIMAYGHLKKVWGTYLSEKIGEFDYVLNQPLYQLIEQVKPRLTKAKIKISRKLKRK